VLEPNVSACPADNAHYVNGLVFHGTTPYSECSHRGRFLQAAAGVRPGALL